MEGIFNSNTVENAGDGSSRWYQKIIQGFIRGKKDGKSSPRPYSYSI